MDHITTATTGSPVFLGPPEAGYLILRDNKAPATWDTLPLSVMGSMTNVGIKMEEPWVVVDIDTASDAEKLLRLVREEKIPCRVMQTTKGMHFWFRTATPLKNVVRAMSGIGIHADYRSWGKQAQVCVKFQGEWREWIIDTPWDDIGEIPKWLRPLRQDKWKFSEMGEGDGRNAALYEYQIMLAERAYSHEEATKVIQLINTYILKDPLPQGELKVVTRPEAYPEPKTENTVTGETYSEDTPWLVTNKNGSTTFLHRVLGDHLAEKLHIKCYHNILYMYKDGYYAPAENQIQQEIIKAYPDCKRMNRAEVLEYLRIQTHIDRGDTDEYVVNVKNGRLDLRTRELTPHSPEHLDFQRINANYDPKYIDFVLEDMLWKVFCGDNSIYKLFDEVVGYCLTRNAKYQKLFILSGEGSNGKSTVIKMLRHFLGEGNVAALSLQNLEDKFKLAELENTLANLGDDIPSLKIRDSSLMKKIVSGDAFMVERKNEKPFIMRPYSKLIFSTNKMPNIADNSHGLGRRLCIIPFDATFSPTDPDFDPNIEEKVMTDKAMTYLLNIALRGFKRLYNAGKFTAPRRVSKATATFRVENNNVLTWLADEEKGADAVIGMGTKAIYQEYRLYCESNGMLPQAKKGVTDVIKKEFGVGVSTLQRRGKGGEPDRYFEAV